MQNPFTDDIFTGELPEAAPVSSFHPRGDRGAGEVIPDAAEAGMGRAMILSAPRAGFGKRICDAVCGGAAGSGICGAAGF